MTDANKNRQENQPEPRKRRYHRSATMRVLFRTMQVLGTVLLIMITTGAIFACFAAVYIKTVIMPEVDMNINDFALGESSIVYYTDSETGEDVEMLSLNQGENRVWVDYTDIPENLVNATIAIEDKRFESHHGVDWIRTLKGMLFMINGEDIQGGSTITQQLIKNMTSENEVTVKRKILEIFRALQFEKSYSKQQIMEWYLNYIYLGEKCYGVATASQTYFHKDVSELSLAECAALISITNNPSMYDPFYNPDANRERRELVLQNMLEQDKITQSEYDVAMEESSQMTFTRGDSDTTDSTGGTVYTWYEEQVITDVLSDLESTYDWSEELASQVLYNGGLRIYTAFDPTVQASVDEVYENTDNLNYTSSSGQQMQSAITVIDNSSGYVVALSGGMGEKTSSLIWNRASQTKRPPGSSIKPLSVYSPALEMGLITPASVFDDVPYKLINGSAWPVNSYDYYKGLLTVNEAVEVSSNPVAVKVLADLVTPKKAYEYLTEKFGITSLDESNDINIAPMALGGLTNGVSTYEMAAAYATFARDGMYAKPRTYTKVLSADGDVLLENSGTGNYVLSENTVFYINELLENVVSSGTGTGANFSGQQIAGKTGTTSTNYDKWFVGYTPYYTAAVWTGYESMEKMKVSNNPSATLWKLVMQKVHEGLEYKDFDEPSDLVTVSYCLDSGKLATEACSEDPRGSRVVTGTFVKGDQPTEYCTVHSSVSVDTSSPILDSSGSETGYYYPATDSTDSESLKTVSFLDYQRNRVDSSVVTRDDSYLLSYYENLIAEYPQGTKETTEDFNPEDSSTWPTDDADFNIDDWRTWPDAGVNEAKGFDSEDYTTWPLDDPDFDPSDSSTWPEESSETNPNSTQAETATGTVAAGAAGIGSGTSTETDTGKGKTSASEESGNRT
ncbi:MAG: Multimodular transpeptidase-transglycosylase [Oscillospiraceae bacterium]|nr:Multimodular transpeptidase-transglycosylase [Oscillospiraceae bacterium]